MSLVDPPNDLWIKAAAAKKLLLGETPEGVVRFIQLMVNTTGDST